MLDREGYDTQDPYAEAAKIADVKLRLRAITEWFSSVARYVTDRKEAFRFYEKVAKYFAIFLGLILIAYSNGALDYQSS